MRKSNLDQEDAYDAKAGVNTHIYAHRKTTPIFSIMDNEQICIELVGGPFCGGIIDATLEDLKVGGTINTPCSSQENTNKWNHLDAVYQIQNDSTATLVGYTETEF